MKVAILGAGGVGAYFGGRWTQAAEKLGIEVSFLARGEHLDALRQRGLKLESPLGSVQLPVRAELDAAAIGAVDLVVVATKTWQLPSACEVLEPLLGPETSVLGLQNGVEAAEILAEAVGRGRVLGGTCRIISYLAGPGEVHHLGADPAILFGELEGGRSSRIEDLEGVLGRAQGVRFESSLNIAEELWKKFLFLAATSGVGSVAQIPLGVMRSLPETRHLMEQAMKEVAHLAEAEGTALDPEAVAAAMAFVDTLPPEATSSMQRDFRDRRRTELEALSGAVHRLGKKHGLETPAHTFLYSTLLPRELRARNELSY